MRNDLNERQKQILEIINRTGKGKVNDLKSRFRVTDMTIRRDLEKLEQKGLLRRTFGGAIPVGRDLTLNERSAFYLEEKIKIGRAAAKTVNEGDAIFLDAGSTIFQVARYINPDLNITVVTNALNVAYELLDKKFNTVVVGGTLFESTASLMGPLAMETIRKMAFDKVFLGTSGLTIGHGFSTSSVVEAEIKRMAVQKASEVNIVIDHTKYGVKQLISFAELHEVNYIFSDQMPNKQLVEKCTENNIGIVIGE